MATLRDNPYGAFNFLVALGGDQGGGSPGEVVGGFSDVSGLATEIDYAEILAAADGIEQGAQGDGDLAVAFLDENWGKPGTPLKPAISVLEGPYRYVVGTDFSGVDFEVLLSTDDAVSGDLMLEQPEVAERLRAAAEEQLGKTALFEAGTYELDEMQLDQLRALGYDLH